MNYPVEDLNKEDHRAMLERSTEQGNHKSALDEE
jgi:hypothetical protein